MFETTWMNYVLAMLIVVGLVALDRWRLNRRDRLRQQKNNPSPAHNKE
jgi:high-affinity Fe2+/Pb2+ permease